MAFSYGSIDLGLKNPFKKEGLITATRGATITLIGLYLLVTAAASVKSDPTYGWIVVIFGMFVLGGGIAATASGITAMLRYFVGRNHPTSLAINRSPSETLSANEEAGVVAYTNNSLLEMLMGRKNMTFLEPVGFLARFLHTIFPRLTYMPYPVRNLAQKIFGAWVKTAVALLAYGLVAFVSLAGFAGDIGEQAFPVYSALLVLYLIMVWRGAGTSINRTANRSMEAMGGGALVKVIVTAMFLPVIISFGAGIAITQSGVDLDSFDAWFSYLPTANTGLYMVGLTVGAVVSSFLIILMLKKRLGYADPKVEVSECRENWQESVHPNEIFINLDNLVMAKRRYKEVPNRVYGELQPKLQEQTDGKGSFSGELMQEVQPRFKPMNLGKAFDSSRLLALLTGNALYLVAALLTMFLAFEVADAYRLLASLTATADEYQRNLGPIDIDTISDHLNTVVHLFLAGVLIKAFARILGNTAHLFYAEMHFESDLIFFRCEGTFTESKISTGTGIYDSTRSENTLVRSSITPLMIVSRLVTSTFAATGIRNLEHPRYILEMHKNDREMQDIRGDVIEFLRDRESIASITSQRDLENTGNLYALNEKTRASIPAHNNPTLTQDAEASGFLREEAQRTPEETESK